jgi:hypothetical protein
MGSMLFKKVDYPIRKLLEDIALGEIALYVSFLKERRRRIAQVIQTGFNKLVEDFESLRRHHKLEIPNVGWQRE